MKLKTKLTISFCIRTKNLTRRGPILAMGVHCSTLLRTPGADLKRVVIEARTCEPKLKVL